MKIRNGFVSNSSSSSFLVLLPEKFEIEDQVLTQEIVDAWNEYMEEEDITPERYKNVIKKFINQECFYEEDEGYDVVGFLHEVFKDNIIHTSDVDSSSGCIEIADRDKILQILNKE